MKKFTILLMSVLLSAPLFAQIDPTVVVDRDYEGKVDLDVRMPDNKISVADSLKVFDVSFDYSIFDRPFRDLYEFSPYQAASLGVVPLSAVPHFSARVASQYPLMPEVDLYGQLVPKNNRDINVGLFVKYASEIGKVPSMLDVVDALNIRRTRMSAGANFKFAWDKGELTFDGIYRHSYAKDKFKSGNLFSSGITDSYHIPRDSAKHSVNAFEFDFKIRSTDVKDHDFYYDIETSFVRTSKGLDIVQPVGNFPFQETAMNIDALFGSSFEEHRMYVNVRSQNNWYSTPEGFYLGIIEFAPIYRYAKGRFDGKFGIRFSNSYSGDNSTSLYPDVDAKLELWKNKLWLRGVANGGRNIDNLGVFLESAPWVVASGDALAEDGEDSEFKMRYTTRPIDSKLSLEGIIGSRLGLNIYGTYTSYKNKLQLYTSHFDYSALPYLYPEFVNYSKLSAGIELTWTSKDLRVFTSVQGNKYYSEETLYMLPKIESLSKIEYNFRERLFLSTALVIHGERESQIGTVPVYLDLSAKAEFKINRFFSAYVKGGNLLNKANYIYADIASMPINVGGGICIDF